MQRKTIPSGEQRSGEGQLRLPGLDRVSEGVPSGHDRRRSWEEEKKNTSREIEGEKKKKNPQLFIKNCMENNVAKVERKVLREPLERLCR